jgi:hypothetical protein
VTSEYGTRLQSPSSGPFASGPVVADAPAAAADLQEEQPDDPLHCSPVSDRFKATRQSANLYFRGLRDAHVSPGHLKPLAHVSTERWTKL